MGLVDAVAVEWRKRVKQSAHYTLPELTNTVHLKIDNIYVDLSSCHIEISLQLGIQNGETNSSICSKRFQDQFPDVQFDWNEIYSLSFKVSLETKIKEFQCKILHNIVFTNERLFKIKIIYSPERTFCKNGIESLKHLFYSCENPFG